MAAKSSCFKAKTDFTGSNTFVCQSGCTDSTENTETVVVKVSGYTAFQIYEFVFEFHGQIVCVFSRSHLESLEQHVVDFDCSVELFEDSYFLFDCRALSCRECTGCTDCSVLDSSRSAADLEHEAMLTSAGHTDCHLLYGFPVSVVTNELASESFRESNLK